MVIEVMITVLSKTNAAFVKRARDLACMEKMRKIGDESKDPEVIYHVPLHWMAQANNIITTFIDKAEYGVRSVEVSAFSGNGRL